MTLLRDGNGQWMTGFQLMKDCTLEFPQTGILIDAKAGYWLFRSWNAQAYLLSDEELTACRWKIIE